MNIQKNAFIYICSITFLFLVFLSIVAATEPKPSFLVDKETEDRIYSKCISHMRVENNYDKMMEQVNTCSDLAKALATMPCDK